MKALLSLLFAAGLSAQSFFLVGSDPQFGMYTKDKDFAQETVNFEFFIATAKRLEPAFVVICGDLTNKPGDPAQIAEYHRIAAKLSPSIKLYNVAGNHDVGNQPTHDTLTAYRKNFGPDWYSFQNAGVYGIVLDSSVISFPTGVEDEAARQEAWLRKELVNATASGLRVAIFQHIPWFLEKAGEPDQYFNITSGPRAKYLALFREHGIDRIFAGHLHRNNLARDGQSNRQREILATAPLGMPIGPDPSGFQIVSITPTGFEHSYFNFGNLPNTYPPGHVK